MSNKLRDWLRSSKDVCLTALQRINSRGLREGKGEERVERDIFTVYLSTAYHHQLLQQQLPW